MTTDIVITAELDPKDFDKVVQFIVEDTGDTEAEVAEKLEADGTRASVTRDEDGKITGAQYIEGGRRRSRLNKKTRRAKGRRRHSVRRKLRSFTARRR